MYTFRYQKVPSSQHDPEEKEFSSLEKGLKFISLSKTLLLVSIRDKSGSLHYGKACAKGTTVYSSYRSSVDLEGNTSGSIKIEKSSDFTLASRELKLDAT